MLVSQQNLRLLVAKNKRKTAIKNASCISQVFRIDLHVAFYWLIRDQATFNGQNSVFV